MEPHKITVQKLISDDAIKHKEGEFFSLSDFPIIITTDTNVYYLHDGEEKLLCAFRKNVIPKSHCQKAYSALHQYAQKWHGNRGASAGVIDIKKVPKYVAELANAGKFRAYYYSKKDGKFHKDHISNLTQSNIIGFYDKANLRNKSPTHMPCRETKFNKDFPDKWQAIQPLLQDISQQFKHLAPDRYLLQLNRANMTPDFQIKDTPFSTITINYNWQTALHKDKGDYDNGFGNLVILEHGKFSGGLLGFPQFGVAVEVRQTDFLAMDVHQWHCNTDLNLESPDAVRLSVVCYLRKNMIKCQTQTKSKKKTKSSRKL